MAGEIKPTRAELSATKDDDEMNYGVGRAFDMDLNTFSMPVAGSDRRIWLKITMDKVRCVKNVIKYKVDGTTVRIWTCTEKDCSRCMGAYCNDFILTVSNEGSGRDPLLGFECKKGDTVTLEKFTGSKMKLPEIAIVREPGAHKLAGGGGG